MPVVVVVYVAVVLLHSSLFANRCALQYHPAIISCWLGLLLLPWMNRILLLLLLCRRCSSSCSHHCCWCSSSATSTLPVVAVDDAADGSSTSSSSYSSFYIRPTAATIPVSVATADDATPTPMAVDDDDDDVDVDDDDDFVNEDDIAPATSLFDGFRNWFWPYQTSSIDVSNSLLLTAS